MIIQLQLAGLARHAHGITLAKLHRSNHHYLIGFEVHLTEMSPFLVPLSGNSWLQVIGSTKEPNASIQLTRHSIKPATNYLLLYLQISLLLDSYHRFFSIDIDLIQRHTTSQTTKNK